MSSSPCPRCGSPIEPWQAACTACGADAPGPEDLGAPVPAAERPRIDLAKPSPVRAADRDAPVPFEDDIGIPSFLDRLVEQFRQSLTEPGRMFERVPRTDSLVAPWVFSLILGIPGLLLVLAVIAILLAIGAFASFKELRDLLPAVAPAIGLPVLAAVVFAGALVGFMFVSFASMVVNGAIHHFALVLLGGARENLNASVRATGYAYALAGPVTLASLIPYLGVLFQLAASVAIFGLAGYGLARAHRTDVWKGMVAALVPIALCCGCGGVLFLVGMIGALDWMPR